MVFWGFFSVCYLSFAFVYNAFVHEVFYTSAQSSSSIFSFMVSGL